MLLEFLQDFSFENLAIHENRSTNWFRFKRSRTATISLKDGHEFISKTHEELKEGGSLQTSWKVILVETEFFLCHD
jgi:hypothetical protein